MTKKNLPLPPSGFGLPFISETLGFFTDRDFVTKYYRKYGKIFKSNILGRPTVFIIGLEANKFILSTHLDYFSLREGFPKSFRELLGRSLAFQDKEEHQNNRRLMMPAFHGKALENYIETMIEITEDYCQQWLKKGKIVWFPEFKQLTFAIASTLLIGADFGDAKGTLRARHSSTSVAQLDRWFTELTKGLFAIPLRLPITTYGKALRARDKILTYLESVIALKRNNLGTDVLSLLMHSEDEEGNSLSLEELKAQAILLLFAGHETTTSLLTSFCMVLARRPDICQKLRDEQEYLGLELPLNLASLKQMTYLERTIEEVGRIYPPIAGGFRSVVEEVEFDGYRIPKGWLVFYRTSATHLDPDIFPNPHEFNPDRHLQRAPEYSLVTYGGGSRVCLGMAFAKMEIKIIAAILLRSYQWELLPNQNLALNIFPTLRPRDGLLVNFTKYFR
jgi:cytochrome P450